MTREQLSVCDAISKHFKLRKADTRTYVEEYIKYDGAVNRPVIEVSSPDGVFNVGISKHTMTVPKMLFFKYFKKTELYADVVNLTNNENVDFVVFYSGKALIAIYRADNYEGIGGIFLKQENTNTGYAIEPIEHYLQHNHPVYVEE